MSVHCVQHASSCRPKNGGQYCSGPEVQCQLCNNLVSDLYYDDIHCINNFIARGTAYIW